MKYLVLWVGIVFNLSSVWGQGITHRVNQEQFDLDDVLELTLVAEGISLPERPAFPRIEGFKKGRYELFQEEIAGQKRFRYTQQYYPIAIGRFEIPAYTIVTRLGPYTTEDIRVRVRPMGSQRLDAYRYKPVPAEIFARLALGQEKAYVGEQVQLRLELWLRKADRDAIQIDRRLLPQFRSLLTRPGLWLEPIENPVLTAREVNRNDTTFLVYELFKGYFFPLSPGIVRLGGFTLPVEQKALGPGRRRRRKERYERLELQLPTVSFTAKSLPPSLLDRAGSVGRFSLVYTLPKPVFSTGEAIPVTLTFKGTGNLGMLPRPVFPGNSKFLLFDPKVEIEWEEEGDTLVGTKHFTYELIPAYPGDYELGPINWYYFNLPAGGYDSLILPVIPLKVRGREIPQILEVKALDNFYRQAFANATSEGPFRLPRPALWLWMTLLLSLAVIAGVGWHWYQK